MTVQPGLCQTCSEPKLLVFSRTGSYHDFPQLKDDFMQLLQDTPDIDRHSKWDDVKDKIDTDPRYLAVNSNSKRERWFNEYKHRLEVRVISLVEHMGPVVQN